MMDGSETVIGLTVGYNLLPTETRRTHGPHAAQMQDFVTSFSPLDH